MSDNIILQSLISEDTPFKVHNVKVETLVCERDLPMMFLSHYDRLSDELKAKKPLDFDLLKRMNDKVIASEACALLDLPNGSLPIATHIKIIGTSVIVWEELPLALYVQFTNTAKDSQAVDGNDIVSLLDKQARQFLLAGNVFVLHKNSANKVISLDNQERVFEIHPSDGYTQLPNSHALATTYAINEMLIDHRHAEQDTLIGAWQESISHAVIDYFDKNQTH